MKDASFSIMETFLRITLQSAGVQYVNGAAAKANSQVGSCSVKKERTHCIFAESNEKKLQLQAAAWKHRVYLT